jgi:hypothetical protein
MISGITLDGVTLLRGPKVRYLILRVKSISGKISGITLDGSVTLLRGKSKVTQQGLRFSPVRELELPPSLPSPQTT